MRRLIPALTPLFHPCPIPPIHCPCPALSPPPTRPAPAPPRPAPPLSCPRLPQVRTLGRPGLRAALPLVMLVGGCTGGHLYYMLAIKFNFALNVKVWGRRNKSKALFSARKKSMAVQQRRSPQQ